MYEKKGQMAGNSVSNIILLVTGVGIAVLVLIFVSALGGRTYDLLEDDLAAIGNNVVKGESLTALNNTAVRAGHGFIQQDTLVMTNNTATWENVAGNFTIDYTAGTFLLNAAPDGYQSLNGTTMYLNYTWGAKEVRDSVQEGIISSFDALEQTGDYLPIIVLAVVIALVLALVLGFTAFGGRMSGGNAL